MIDSHQEKKKLIKGVIGGKIRRTYYMAYPESEKDISDSLNYYKIGESASITMTQLAGGTFLASLLLSQQFSEQGLAIVFGLSNIAAIIQIFTAVHVEKMLKRKPFVCGSVLLKFCFGLLFFVPVIMRPGVPSKLLIAMLFLLAYIGMQISNSPAKDWVSRMVNIRRRGYYFAKTDAFSVIAITIFTITMGFVMDWFKDGYENIGFMIVGSVLLGLGMINFITFSRMKEKRVTRLNSQGKEIHGSKLKRIIKTEAEEKSLSLFGEIKYALSSLNFRRELILGMLFATGFQMGLPFNASYQIKELGLSFTFIMVAGSIANILRILISPKIGNLGDRLGMAKVLKFAFIGLLMHHVMMAFSTTSNAIYMIPIAIVFAALAWSFVGTGLFNVQLELLDESRLTIQLSIVSLITSVWGYITILISTKIYGLFATLFAAEGSLLFPQQGLNVINAGVYGLIILYIHYKIEPLNDRKGENYATNTL